VHTPRLATCWPVPSSTGIGSMIELGLGPIHDNARHATGPPTRCRPRCRMPSWKNTIHKVKAPTS
jgi:hypothetical protein